jgi:membrane protease YdiL (CAAX protease family)
MTKSPAWPFVAPFFVFLAFLSVESQFPDLHYVLYPIKTICVTAVLAWYWRLFPSLKPGTWMLSLGVGVLGVTLWIALDPWAMRLNGALEELFNRAVQAAGMDSWQTRVEDTPPAGRNPFQLYPAMVAWWLFGFRVAGISLCVPVMEELFWRGFLMRWLIKEDFTSVPLGTYQPASFAVTTAFFAAVHGPEWPLGLVVGVLYGAWFVRTKRLGDIMLAHGVTNMLLAFYCLATDDWHFLSVMTPSAHRG